MIEFIDSGHRHINETLRNALPPDETVQGFLDTLPLMADYTGTSYRVSHITRTGLAALQRGHARRFADLGAQYAFVLPRNAAAWALRTASAYPHDGLCELYSIFDESVPQKNLSSSRLADLVVVPPASTLCLKALSFVVGTAPARAGRTRVVAHFGRAEPSCAARYDLFSGTRHR
ncbi:hypothetical protein B0G83_12533 [Paraburkholderia sp. BL21I4N1]|nr:hypothetical protein B0G83_12533 [Paraburkholderia sp. BL21I4N1]